MDSLHSKALLKHAVHKNYGISTGNRQLIGTDIATISEQSLGNHFSQQHNQQNIHVSCT